MDHLVKNRNMFCKRYIKFVLFHTGARVWKFADPIGAVLITLYIIIGWIITGRGQLIAKVYYVLVKVYYI